MICFFLSLCRDFILLVSCFVALRFRVGFSLFVIVVSLLLLFHCCCYFIVVVVSSLLLLCFSLIVVVLSWDGFFFLVSFPLYIPHACASRGKFYCGKNTCFFSLCLLAVQSSWRGECSAWLRKYIKYYYYSLLLYYN